MDCVAVGVTVLAGWTRLGASVASAWLIGVAANLAFGGFYDIAVRDVMIAVAAFTLARMAEVREESRAGAATGTFASVVR